MSGQFAVLIHVDLFEDVHWIGSILDLETLYLEDQRRSGRDLLVGDLNDTDNSGDKLAAESHRVGCVQKYMKCTYITVSQVGRDDQLPLLARANVN